MRTAEEIQGLISEIQEDGSIDFNEQVEAINELLNDWKLEIETNHTTDLVMDIRKQSTYTVTDFTSPIVLDPRNKLEE